MVRRLPASVRKEIEKVLGLCPPERQGLRAVPLPPDCSAILESLGFPRPDVAGKSKAIEAGELADEKSAECGRLVERRDAASSATAPNLRLRSVPQLPSPAALMQKPEAKPVEIPSPAEGWSPGAKEAMLRSPLPWRKAIIAYLESKSRNEKECLALVFDALFAKGTPLKKAGLVNHHSSLDTNSIKRYLGNICRVGGEGAGERLLISGAGAGSGGYRFPWWPGEIVTETVTLAG